MRLCEFADVQPGLAVTSAKGTPGTVTEVTDEKLCCDGEGPAVRILWSHGGVSVQNQNLLDRVTVVPA